MSGKLKKEIRLIHTDPSNNNNKYWYGLWHEDGTFISKFGRVGYDGQEKNYGVQGEDFILKKQREKEKKGYTPLRTIQNEQTNTSTTVVQDLGSIVRSQIKVGSPELSKLIERLVKANIHTIVASTSITYNATTGLFQTPLGVVTLDGINDARVLLNQLKDQYDQRNQNEITKTFGQYIRLIPHNFGMKIRLDDIITDGFFGKESDILDSLKVSYETLVNTPAVSKDGSKPKTTQQVFDVSLDLLKDPKEHKRIVDKYFATRKDQHVCRHLKPKNIYTLRIGPVWNAFEAKGKSLDNHRELWHGTRTPNLLSILKGGLKISPPNSVSKAGALFGRGLYFAIDSTKSLNYSYGYWTGGGSDSNCFMFLADVALGKYYHPKYGQSIPSGYDSSWARAHEAGVRNDEIITRNEHQCNLKYLLEFST